MSINIEVEHGGKSYKGVVMKIKSTTLGIEDHGVMVAYLNCDGSGTGVGVGGMVLDEWDKELKRRVGSAYGLDYVLTVLKTLKAPKWESLPGKDIIVLFDPNHYGLGTSPVGFADITGTRVMDFKKHAEDFLGMEESA